MISISSSGGKEASMDKVLKLVQDSGVHIDTYRFIASILLSFLSSGVIALLYYTFFENRRRGAQVHRFFLIGGPAITSMLLAIQFSLPLSLGLLGALSFIRFRTPIKEPEEVAYVLLLISVSIACATFNFVLAGILLAMSIVGLVVQKFVPFAFIRVRKKGAVLLSFSGDRAKVSGGEIEAAVRSELPNGVLESIAAEEGFVSYHYSFEGKANLGMERVLSELVKKTRPDKVNVYWGG